MSEEGSSSATATKDERPDIFILGFQEMVDLTPVNVVITNQKILERLAYWKHEIEETINSSDYTLLVEKHLVGLLLLIYVRRPLVNRIKDIRGIILPTGVLGIMGNKGAVGVRFNLDLTSICVICSHFHSGRDSVMLRNIDYRHIVEKSVFVPVVGSDSTANVLARPESIGRWWYEEWFKIDYHLFDHDLIFWLGDLNYRVEVGPSSEEVLKAMQAGQWRDYLPKDQLLIERSKRTVFEDFEEGEITFPPTYKYQPGTDIFECRPDKKLRAPAWCDRILYRYNHNLYPNSMRLLEYRPTRYLLSDHKPVHALFECEIRVSLTERQREVYQSLLRVIDHWENSTAPKIELVNRHLDFGLVDCMVEKTIIIPIKNIGAVFARWSFVPKLDESQVCERWLRFHPMQGVLAPGQVAVLISYSYS
jgi:inositol polyphosphate 5-phosphatase INPP5B/F